MPQEKVLGSFIVRVVVQLQKRLYTLQDLRTGEQQAFSSGRDVLKAIEHSSRPPSSGEDKN